MRMLYFGIVGFVLLIYVGGYALLVKRWEVMGGIGRYDAPEATEAGYGSGTPDSTPIRRILFFPLHWLDRRIRADYWSLD